MKASDLQPLTLIPLLCRVDGYPEPAYEVRFHPTRKWKFDVAWLDDKIALEIEGAVFQNGRHTRGKGYLADCEKYSEAAILGWIVLRVGAHEPHKIGDLLKRAFQSRRAAA